MTKRGRIWTGAAIGSGFCVAYLWFFGVATAIALETRYVAWKSPVVTKVPIELSDKSISGAAVSARRYFGYQFEVPWEIDEGKSRLVGGMQLIALRSGNAILFSKMPPGEFVQRFSSSSSLSSNDLKTLYGEDELLSDYYLLRRILEATPANITPFSSRKDAVSIATLVMVKGIMVPAAADSGVFHVKAPGYEGFQYGDPQRRPKSISVEMFANDASLSFIFTQKDKSSIPSITQPEINRVIQTIRQVREH